MNFKMTSICEIMYVQLKNVANLMRAYLNKITAIKSYKREIFQVEKFARGAIMTMNKSTILCAKKLI